MMHGICFLSQKSLKQHLSSDHNLLFSGISDELFKLYKIREGDGLMQRYLASQNKKNQDRVGISSTRISNSNTAQSSSSEDHEEQDKELWEQNGVGQVRKLGLVHLLFAVDAIV